ncbi:RNA methyltransferase [Paenibacillus aurantius]|uniref:RNA methyltransferase n=1 Tax=Paenibacillus aurantius TaxID=2918900 RepID=A0AA96LE50_9BACL|nr:RNA methyltransferase [Paenibacillus aurantius]WNQ12384.1 RNA methyltransferase [Paenibacillus aurantius]
MGCLYTYACHEEEEELCRMERRALFGTGEEGRDGAETAPSLRGKGWFRSARRLDPGRSPFLHERMDIQYEAESLEELQKQVKGLELGGRTFKVMCLDTDNSWDYTEKRRIERELGAAIRGRAEMKKPERRYGAALVHGRLFFGPLQQGEAHWLKHKNKPQNYSTALTTRMARAVVNVAVPEPEGVRAVDPCCGIGTVLVEALSMGIAIEGFDLNPLAVRGARANLAHFGFPDVVRLADMRRLTGRYDAAVVDLPYNLCSVLPPEERQEMLQSARRLADRVVLITTEGIEAAVEEAGFTILDRCLMKKGSVERRILLCE